MILVQIISLPNRKTPCERAGTFTCIFGADLHSTDHLTSSSVGKSQQQKENAKFCKQYVTIFFYSFHSDYDFLYDPIPKYYTLDNF